MLKSISIENYKSIEKVEIDLGRINVFIGENGAGKSNILEAIALAGAAQARKLDNEFLASRGIRVSGPELMRSAFRASSAVEPIKVSTKIESGSSFRYVLTNDNQPYSSWQNSINTTSSADSFKVWFEGLLEGMKVDERKAFLADILKKLNSAIEGAEVPGSGSEINVKLNIPGHIQPPAMDSGGIEDFIIYAPENSALRTFEREGQIEPLGINGEGLLKLLRVMSRSRSKKPINTIKDSLRLFSWFKDFRVVTGKSGHRIEVLDQFVDEVGPNLDQRSASEGFLFLAFYFALFTSKLTPRIFAIDNVDASLNPKLCQALMSQLVKLAKENNKQVLFTTHNPALLDGLNIGDSDNRLFVVSRGSEGATRVRRFEKKPSTDTPRRLSELFLSGALGGLPRGF